MSKMFLKIMKLGHFSGLFIITEEKQLSITPHDQCHAHQHTVQSERPLKSSVPSGCSISGNRIFFQLPPNQYRRKILIERAARKNLLFIFAKLCNMFILWGLNSKMGLSPSSYERLQD